MTEGIIGGVSPLKARQSSRGGKEAGKATQTARKLRATYEGPGGFAKSKGKRGAGGKNVGGYNVRTRFGPVTPWVKPTSGGTIGGDIVKSILGGGGGGGSQSQSQSQTQGTDGYWEHYDVEHEYGDMESYRKVWDKNDNNLQDKHKTYEDFVKAAEEWWETDEGKAEREKRKKGKYTTKHKRWIPGTSGTQSQTQKQTQNN